MNPPLDNPAAPKAPKLRYGVVTLMLVALLSAAIATGAIMLVQPWIVTPPPAAPPAPEPTLYQCPMHPTITQDHPGDCPICGMKLVKVDASKQEGAGKATGVGAAAAPVEVTGTPGVVGLVAVEIDPARQQLIGLQTIEVTLGPVGGAWRTVGRIAIDETRVRHFNLKVPGFVERIYVDFVGKKVNKGDPLFSIYSPELLAAQEEYLLALRMRGSLSKAGGSVAGDGDALLMAARRKLALWDVPDAEIDRLAATGQPTKTLTFNSPIAGVVTKKDVVEGMKLDAGAMPYEIVDLSSVWVLADVYESELRFVKENMSGTLALNAFPNREFKGKVVFIDPLLDPQTRTVKVRLTFPNPTGELRPGMFGDVILLGTAHEGLRISPDAVIDSGTEKVVFVAVGEGKFQPRKVKLGDSDATHVEVLSGLTVGERVVSRANFLIDSESRLRASLAGMAGGGSPEAPQSAQVLKGAAAPPEVPASAPTAGAPSPKDAPGGASDDHRGHRR